MRQTARLGAFTLPESMMAAAVLAIAVVAVSQAIVAAQAQAYHAAHAQRGIMLAEAMIERILALPYNDPDGASAPGPEGGELTLADFDNADDFHGYSEAAGQVADLAGQVYPAPYDEFARSVTAAYGTSHIPEFGDALPGLTLSVTVTDANNRSWSLTRFIPEPEPDE